jgi:hypothetical protein
VAGSMPHHQNMNEGYDGFFEKKVAGKRIKMSALCATFVSLPKP